MVAYESWELRMALQIALQVRGCPPDRLLFAEPRNERITEHLTVCLFCRDSLEDGPGSDAWEQLAQRLRSEPLPVPAHPIAPGQIWSLHSSLGGWGPKRRYYSPPLVLVLGFPPPFKDAVNVVQVYNDPTLAAPGDVMLDEVLFAESWNTYTLLRGDLEHLMGTVSEETLRKVIETASEELAEPADMELSPVMAFRRLEIAVGAFFASRAVGQLMAVRDLEPGDRILDLFSTTEELKRFFTAQQHSLKWPAKDHNTIEALALAELPADELPLAAADDENLFFLKHVVVKGPELQVLPGVGQITVSDRRGDVLLLGGRIQSDVGEEAVLYAWWSVPEERLLQPSELQFNPENGFYRVVFSGIGDTEFAEGRLLLLTCESLE